MTVGIIVGMASLVTLLVILLSIGFLVIRHIVFRRQHPNTALIADIAILTSSQQRESVVLMEQNPLANIDQVYIIIIHTGIIHRQPAGIRSLLLCTHTAIHTQ